MSTHFRIAGPDVVHEEFGGDLVILNIASGQYFGLNAEGAALWTALAGGQRIDNIAADEDTRATVASFAQRLTELALITASDDAPAHTDKAITLTQVPQIEVYDDLADLIVADPIHDVDAEGGWPKMPDSA